METLVAARNAFIHGEAHMSEIARRFKIRRQTLHKYATQEDWTTRRKIFMIQADRAAQAATLDQIRYPQGAKPTSKGPGESQIERCNTALASCVDPNQAAAWMKVLAEAQRVAYLDRHGFYPPQGKPAAQEPPQAKQTTIPPGSRRVSPLTDKDPEPDQPEIGGGV